MYRSRTWEEVRGRGSQTYVSWTPNCARTPVARVELRLAWTRLGAIIVQRRLYRFAHIARGLWAVNDTGLCGLTARRGECVITAGVLPA